VGGVENAEDTEEISHTLFQKMILKLDLRVAGKHERSLRG
jgi:hypothetical protein